jgi:hypothetical protein
MVRRRKGIKLAMWVSFGVVNVGLKLEWSRFVRHASATFPLEFSHTFSSSSTDICSVFSFYLRREGTPAERATMTKTGPTRLASFGL